MQAIGKYLILVGVIIIAAGVLLAYFPKLNFIGKLPGDIVFKKGSYSFYFPLVTSIIISIILTLVFWLINYFSRR